MKELVLNIVCKVIMAKDGKKFYKNYFISADPYDVSEL